MAAARVLTTNQTATKKTLTSFEAWESDDDDVSVEVIDHAFTKFGTPHIDVEPCPHLDVFYGSKPARITLVSGCTSNIVRLDVAIALHIPITPSQQQEIRADGFTSLDVVGEVNIVFRLDSHELVFHGLVCEMLDVPIRAGELFQSDNDVYARPSRKTVYVGECAYAYTVTSEPRQRVGLCTYDTLHSDRSTSVFHSEDFEAYLSSLRDCSEGAVEAVTSWGDHGILDITVGDEITPSSGKALASLTHNDIMVSKNRDHLCRVNVPSCVSPSPPAAIQAVSDKQRSGIQVMENYDRLCSVHPAASTPHELSLLSCVFPSPSSSVQAVSEDHRSDVHVTALAADFISLPSCLPLSPQPSNRAASEVQWSDIQVVKNHGHPCPVQSVTAADETSAPSCLPPSPQPSIQAADDEQWSDTQMVQNHGHLCSVRPASTADELNVPLCGVSSPQPSVQAVSEEQRSDVRAVTARVDVGYLCSVHPASTADELNVLSCAVPSSQPSFQAVSEEQRSDVRAITARGDVFGPVALGFGGSYDAILAVVDMGPAPPPRRRVRTPLYPAGYLQWPRKLLDVLEEGDVIAEPETFIVNDRFVGPASLVTKSDERFCAVTVFADIGRFARPTPSLIPDMVTTIHSIAQWRYIIWDPGIAT